ncbi:hypothetical protein K8R33_04810 [archaeon]|nr:hypothetical protein [archaeon]
MSRTIQIHGSNEVMAMFGKPGVFFRGEWEEILVTKPGEDKDTPLEIRTGLVGLIVPTIFTKESIEKQTGASFDIPENSRFAYCIDVVNVLRTAGKYSEAERLEVMAGGSLDMYSFESGCYELVHLSS